MFNNILEKEDGTKKFSEECKKVVSNAETIIVFGAGVGGKQLFEFLEENHLSHKICAFSDNNELKFCSLYCGIPIVPPKQLYEKFPLATIIIASSAYPQIKGQLLQGGFSEEKIFLFNFAFSDLKYTDKEFIYDNINNFERAFNLLDDSKSKNIFINLLNYKITKNEKFLTQMYEYVDDEREQYFDFELYNLIDEEIIVDVGAFTGDTLKCFCDYHNAKYKEYLCFEADPNTYLELEKNVSSNGYVNVILYNMGLWNRKGNIKLSIENYGSSEVSEIEDGNFTCIYADKLDDVVKEKKITFIKMDIEGAEFNALCGMRETIIKNKPILAISVYHKRDDYFKLLDYINLLHSGEEYKFYFRQYRYTPTETVCYAIPKSRDIRKID